MTKPRARRRVLACAAGTLALVLTLFPAASDATASVDGWRDVDLDKISAPSAGVRPVVMEVHAGVYHALFGRPQGGPIVYGQCTSACDRSASWDVVELQQTTGYYLQIALTADGAPRAAWRSPVEDTVNFASCDRDCLRAGSWSHVVLDEVDDDLDDGDDGGISISYNVQVSLALDDDGNPSVSYTRPGETSDLLFAQCRSACGSADSWGAVVLQTSADGSPTATGQTVTFRRGHWMVFHDELVTGSSPVLKTCDRSCLEVGSWRSETLDLPRKNGSVFDVRFDGDRAALVYGLAKKKSSSQERMDSWLVYTECERDCWQGANWAPAIVFDDVGDQFSWNDYLLWETGRHYHKATRPQVRFVGGAPRVTYSSCVDCGLSSQEQRVFLAACDGGCSERGSWSVDALGFTGPDGIGPALGVDGGGLRVLYTRYTPGATEAHLFLAWCDDGCASPPTPVTSTTTTSTSSTTTSSTTTTSTSSTTTTTTPSSDPAHAPSAPTLGRPAPDASLLYGQPEKYTLTSTDPDGDPYQALVVVTNAVTGELVATYESGLTLSGLEASVKPSGPLAPGTYDWTARAVDVNGLRSPYAETRRFTVG